MHKALELYPAAGGLMVFEDDKVFISAYWDGAAPAAAAAGTGRPVQVKGSGVYGAIIIAPATQAVSGLTKLGGIHRARPGADLGTPVSDPGYVWVQIGGEDDDVWCTGHASWAIGTSLCVLNATPTVVTYEGAAGTIIVSTHAQAVVANTTVATNNTKGLHPIRWLSGLRPEIGRAHV